MILGCGNQLFICDASLTYRKFLFYLEVVVKSVFMWIVHPPAVLSLDAVSTTSRKGEVADLRTLGRIGLQNPSIQKKPPPQSIRYDIALAEKYQLYRIFLEDKDDKDRILVLPVGLLKSKY
ncbi:hypothetical protein C0J52_13343 [Blattella germanica]|nr:hypothetical protein C0J52_13343 [Blattella germanica]